MTALPNAAELHELARAGGMPPVFGIARTRMDLAAKETEIARDEMHALIREAHRQGIGPAVLARWSGYDPSRVYQILDA